MSREVAAAIQDPAALESELPQSCLGTLLAAWVTQVRAGRLEGARCAALQ